MKTQEEKAEYIINYINTLQRQDRIEILRMIIYSSTGRDKINDKDDGTQIKISDISDELLQKIYNNIKSKIDAHDDITYDTD